MITYESAIEYIDSTPKFTKKNKADNTRELIRRLGNPQKQMKIVHVAGTNGKGSVCAFLSNMLTEGGYKTGLFISPHLIKINERFQINNTPVSDDVFLHAYQEVMGAIEDMMKDGFFHPTYFEILFAIAMAIFRDEKVEYCVLETGLGGRLDATNIVDEPIASVITSISLDHTEYLGDTVGAIAGEKAGIIKEGVPLIYDGRCEESRDVLLSRAAAAHSAAFGIREDMLEIVSGNESSIDFMLKIPYYEGHVITVPYIAPYQVVNCAVALLAMEVIDPDHRIDMERRLDAVKNTKWQGRMEMVLPQVVVDGAHNEDGVREFIRTLYHVRSDRRIVLLFSAVVEKNYEEMIRSICETECFDEVVVTEIQGARVVPTHTLAEVFRRYTKVPVIECQEIEEGFLTAMERKKDGYLFCVGSLYLVGEVKKVIEEKYHD